MQQKIKSLFTVTLLFSLLIFNTNCSSDDGLDDEIDCATVTASLEATLSIDVSSICGGEEAVITITGTPNSTVSLSNDSPSPLSGSLGESGTASWSVSPTFTTNYILNRIELDGCGKTLSETVTLTVGGPVITENIVGTWAVIDANDQSDGKTVTFNSNGTGTAPQDGSFTMYSTLLQESSTGFTFEYEEFQQHFMMRFNYPSATVDQLIRYEVDLNDCDEVILRDVTNVVDPQNKFTLTRQ